MITRHFVVQYNLSLWYKFPEIFLASFLMNENRFSILFALRRIYINIYAIQFQLYRWGNEWYTWSTTANVTRSYARSPSVARWSTSLHSNTRFTSTAATLAAFTPFPFTPCTYYNIMFLKMLSYCQTIHFLIIQKNIVFFRND